MTVSVSVRPRAWPVKITQKNSSGETHHTITHHAEYHLDSGESITVEEIDSGDTIDEMTGEDITSAAEDEL